jgi:hypothetical protein
LTDHHWYSGDIVNLRGTDKASRWPSFIAIVAMLCLVSALVGSWAVRSAATTPGSLQLASEDVIDTGGDVIDLSRVHLADISQSARHFDHKGPLSSNQKSYKTAGIKRNRPPNWSRSAPPEWWLPTPSSLTAPEYRPTVSNNRLPARSLSGQELLNQICVARC